jgi:LemA protein
VILGFNNLVSRRNRVQDAWAQIDVQLKRRYDLIPNLVQTVQSYAKFERGTLTSITQLRTSIISGSVQDKAQANNKITQALKSIFAVAENYPQLQASKNFLELQDQLTDTENKISFVRTSYNDYVLDYNNAVQSFPGSVFASTFHFADKMDFFQAVGDEKNPVKVDFSGLDQQPGSQAPAPKAQAKGKK